MRIHHLNCGSTHPYFPRARAMNVLPAWAARLVIGPHVPRLRALAREHGNEVQLISGHDMYAFTRHQAQ